MSNRTLVSWVGHTDLASMAADEGGKIAAQVEKEIRRDIRATDDGGPIAALLNDVSFDSIILLSNYPKAIEKAFEKWLGLRILFVKPKPYKTPNDYESLFKTADDFIGRLYRGEFGEPPKELSIHLSPGTPAMAAVWVLLGKSKYRAKFYQSFPGKKLGNSDPV